MDNPPKQLLFGLAEETYLAQRELPKSAVPGDLSDVVQRITQSLSDNTEYDLQVAYGVRNHWLDIRRRVNDPKCVIKFKLFIGAWKEDEGFDGWLAMVRTAIDSTINLHLSRIKICVSPDRLNREDGVVIYVSESEFPLAVGYLIGSLPLPSPHSAVQAPRFTAPIPGEPSPALMFYVQSEGTVPKWLPQDRVYSSRESRSLALQRVLSMLDREPESANGNMLDDAEVRIGMETLGYSGRYYHLDSGNLEPLVSAPLLIWDGYLRALATHWEAREPEKLSVLEKLTNTAFSDAVLTLAEGVPEPSETGSQRKFVLTLPGGVRALFRPARNRMTEGLSAAIDVRGFDDVVSPYWQRQIPQSSHNAAGFRAFYEREIGSPEREVAASLLASFLGSRLLSPARIACLNGERGSVQILCDVVAAAAPPARWNTRQFELELAEANLLDYLMACNDRLENWEVSADGHLLLVDNTQTFGGGGKYHRTCVLNSARWRRALVDRLRILCHCDVRAIFRGLLSVEECDQFQQRAQLAIKYIDEVADELFERDTLVG